MHGPTMAPSSPEEKKSSSQETFNSRPLQEPRSPPSKKSRTRKSPVCPPPPTKKARFPTSQAIIHSPYECSPKFGTGSEISSPHSKISSAIGIFSLA
ncbi:hypothetical protein AVEN_257251-1 [Araneus ventricosus]|uniref:Uncharacterized protein n=1 Tax=Araneus ventricosus TaxID=182803 RepID=A0A4Y2NML4_ARAVE|nr:hypothetical protein AVEN_257251-1 [Araneus ventricosus]